MIIRPRPTGTLVAFAVVLVALGGPAAVRAPAPPVGAGRQLDRGELGSTRHARVAIPMEGERRELTVVAGSLTEEDVAELRRVAPNVRVLTGLSRAEVLRVAPEVHGLDGRYCTSEIMQAATQLRWVQAPSAGVDRYLTVPELRTDDRVVFTNMQGVHGVTIADHAFAMLLTLTRDLRYYLDPAQRGTWNRRGSGIIEPVALRGRTLLVVGLGGIGRAVAQRGKGFGMRVLATRRSRTSPPPYVDRQGTADDLLEFLGEADVVVLCVPLTDETTGLIGERELATLRPGAYLVNIARGKVVDTAALVGALEEGHLAGAALDVTDPEPLPPDHPLWQMPNVVITPHVASRSALTQENRRVLYVENIRRFGAGEPLLNVVDKEAGY